MQPPHYLPASSRRGGKQGVPSWRMVTPAVQGRHHVVYHGQQHPSAHPARDSNQGQVDEPKDDKSRHKTSKRKKEYLVVRKMMKIKPTEKINPKVTAPHDEELEEFIKTLPGIDRKRRVYNHEPFPERLYRMLCDAESQKFDHIICFNKAGTSIRIHDEEEFEKEVGPAYFRHCKYASFRRQLSMYGFLRRESKGDLLCMGEDAGSFYHKLFRRGRPDLLALVLRTSELEDEAQRKLFGRILYPPTQTRRSHKRKSLEN